MGRISFLFAHLLAGAVLLTSLIGAIGIVIAVLFGMTDAWMLLLAALFAWYGVIGALNLRSWFARTPGNRLAVDPSGFIIDGLRLPFVRVAEIRCRSIVTDKRQNFVKAGKDYTVLASIVCRDGQIYKLRAGQGPVTWFGPTYGAQDSKSLLEKLRTGHQRTSATWIAE